MFTGRLLIDGTEIRSIESLPRVVMPNSTSRLSFVIPIEVEGDYRVEGLVNFDGYESETLFVEFTPDPAGTALGLNSGGGEEDGGGIDAMLVLVIVLAVAVVGGGAWLIAMRRRSADGAGSLGAELAEPEAEEHETELVGPGA